MLSYKENLYLFLAVFESIALLSCYWVHNSLFPTTVDILGRLDSLFYLLSIQFLWTSNILSAATKLIEDYQWIDNIFLYKKEPNVKFLKPHNVCSIYQEILKRNQIVKSNSSNRIQILDPSHLWLNNEEKNYSFR